MSLLAGLIESVGQFVCGVVRPFFDVTGKSTDESAPAANDR